MKHCIRARPRPSKARARNYARWNHLRRDTKARRPETSLKVCTAPTSRRYRANVPRQVYPESVAKQTSRELGVRRVVQPYFYVCHVAVQKFDEFFGELVRRGARDFRLFGVSQSASFVLHPDDVLAFVPVEQERFALTQPFRVAINYGVAFLVLAADCAI